MIESIKIQKFRNINDLTIGSLSRINLITGKNNSGKSTLLEALAIYITKCDLNVIFQLLEDRGENYSKVSDTRGTAEANIKSLSSLFTNRTLGFAKTDKIVIKPNYNTLVDYQNIVDNSVTLRFVKYYDDIVQSKDEISNQRKRIIIDDDSDRSIIDYKLGLEIGVGSLSTILTLEEERLYSRVRYRNIGNIDNFQFIKTRNIDREINGKLWDNITLTEKEEYVIKALKIIEPNIERIAFINDGSTSRSAVIKLSNSNSVFPIRSMGDGINRIMTIILALVNSDNGFLLIDEFENGLHHSVQEKLWSIIFELSAILNIQIFATTHSEDCIAGFETILNKADNNVEGRLIRLDNSNGVIKQVAYTKDQIRIAMKNDIETRTLLVGNTGRPGNSYGLEYNEKIFIS